MPEVQPVTSAVLPFNIAGASKIAENREESRARNLPAFLLQCNI
jgi:hypothetical protein